MLVRLASRLPSAICNSAGPHMPRQLSQACCRNFVALIIACSVGARAAQPTFVGGNGNNGASNGNNFSGNGNGGTPPGLSDRVKHSNGPMNIDGLLAWGAL